jgi:hypothetical protein
MRCLGIVEAMGVPIQDMGSRSQLECKGAISGWKLNGARPEMFFGHF